MTRARECVHFSVLCTTLECDVNPVGGTLSFVLCCNASQVIGFVLSCQQENGGFGGNIGHDAHLLYTLSAVQILCLFDALPRLDVPRVLKYVASLQRPDGAFKGDEWGEIDTRFSYCALCCVSLLGHMDALDVDSAVAFVRRCENFDGGYGCVPGGESHAGQVFTCVGALAIAGALDGCQRDLLSWWLCERQTPGGGLNGRPQKDADVCYSWWVSAVPLLVDESPSCSAVLPVWSLSTLYRHRSSPACASWVGKCGSMAMPSATSYFAAKTSRRAEFRISPVRLC